RSLRTNINSGCKAAIA
ncbi:hypothetical protein D046_0864B, partial [Vibrio parahaemolyticus V-223/04]